MFLLYGPNGEDLCSIARYVGPLRDQVWQMILNGGDWDLCNDMEGNLLYLIRYVEELRDRAWQELLKRGMSDESLRVLISEVNPLKETAARMLIGRSPTRENFCHVINRVDSLKAEAGKMFLGLGSELTNKDLCFIIVNVEELSDLAWTELYLKRSFDNRGPTKEDLCFIIMHSKKLRNEAAQLLLGKNPNNNELECIIKYAPAFREEAGALLGKGAKEIIEEILQIAGEEQQS